MNIIDYFIRYDVRREKTTIRPMGVVVILQAALLLLGAVFGTWKALTNTTVAVALEPTPQLDGWLVTDTSGRPVNWGVSQAEDFGDGVVRFALPSEVEQMVAADFAEAWQNTVANVLDPDTLEKNAEIYYTGPWLVQQKRKIQTIREYRRVAIPIEQSPPPFGLPAFQVEGVLPDGKTAFVRQTLGTRVFSFLTEDGPVDESQPPVTMPAEQNIYRIVFSDALRRWQIAEQVEGPIVLPPEVN